MFMRMEDIRVDSWSVKRGGQVLLYFTVETSRKVYIFVIVLKEKN